MRASIMLALAATIAGCGSDSGPSGGATIETTTFAASLGIDLAQMTKTSSGLYYREITTGSGALAGPGSRVSLHYAGWLANGTQFDANEEPAQPLQFTLGAGQVIPGFDEGVRGMKVGGRRQLIIPPSLGYGGSQVGPIPPNSILVFRVDLVAVQ